jgi:hypothetical protein
MPDLNEILRSLTGAWRLLRRDPSGTGYFDLTLEGFWRSFGAIVLVAPLYLIAIEAEHGMLVENQSEAASGSSYLLIKSLFFLAEWISYVILMVFLTRLLGLGAFFVSYIIAYNWAAVITAALAVPPFVLYGLGALGAVPAIMFSLMVTGLILYYHWYVALVVLRTRTAIAAGLVAMEFLLSLVFNAAADRLIGG